MARVNVYLPDDLADAARAAGLNVSGLTRAAVQDALARTRTDAWLDDVAALPPTGASHDAVTTAIDQAREDLDRETSDHAGG